MPAEIAYIGLGANLGDRRCNIDAALEKLAVVPGVLVEAVSSLRDSEPVGCPPGQSPYLNGVARLRVGLSPHALLSLLKQLEREAGRDMEAPRNAARPLDLDILLFGDRVIDTRELVVPHPRLAERAFVTAPLAELGAAIPAAAARPLLIDDTAAMVRLVDAWRSGGCSVGLVPTMGALHDGHASLLRAARNACDRVVATIFVNPLQFGAGEDLDKYPRTFDADRALLAAESTDALFAPRADAMYGEGFASHVAVGREAETMEGATRPGHFSGVATVVAKLFNIVRPTHAFFGQKDAQQVAVLRRLVADLSYPIDMRIEPIVREPDGLALSSRNVYLDPAQRAGAPAIYRGLCAAREAFVAGERDVAVLLATARAVIDREPSLRIDYLEIRDDETLQLLTGGQADRGRILVAAYSGATRLLDNLALGGGE